MDNIFKFGRFFVDNVGFLIFVKIILILNVKLVSLIVIININFNFFIMLFLFRKLFNFNKILLKREKSFFL